MLGFDYANSDGLPRLAGAPADASLVSEALRQIGVPVTGPLNGLDSASFWIALREFASSLRNNDTALFYFAGHGIQSEGRNYIVASDGVHLISIDEIVGVLRAAANSIVILLDACRDNPFGSALPLPVGSPATTRTVAGARGALRSAIIETSSGLAQMSTVGRGILFVYSTDPNRVALDTLPGERHSPFAKSLATLLPNRLNFLDIVAQVTADVNQSTAGRQTPWTQGSLDRTIYLAGDPDGWMRRGSQGAPGMPPP